MKTPEEEKFQIAVHEQGHRLIDLKYKKHCRIVILAPEQRYPEHLNASTLVAGYVERDQYQTATPFQQAVAAWGGIMGELLANVPKPTIPISLPVNAKNLRAIFGEVMVGFNQLSGSDQRIICDYKKSLWVTFKRAYHILRRKKKELVRLAEQMCRAGEKQLLLETPVSAKSESDAIKIRAAQLKEFLAGMAQSNPDRPRLEKILAHLERGEWPSAELARTKTAAQKI